MKVALEVALNLRLYSTCNSSNGAPDVALEGTLHNRVNVALEEFIKRLKNDAIKGEFEG